MKRFIAVLPLMRCFALLLLISASAIAAGPATTANDDSCDISLLPARRRFRESDRSRRHHERVAQEIARVVTNRIR